MCIRDRREREREDLSASPSRKPSTIPSSSAISSRFASSSAAPSRFRSAPSACFMLAATQHTREFWQRLCATWAPFRFAPCSASEGKASLVSCAAAKRLLAVTRWCTPAFASASTLPASPVALQILRFTTSHPRCFAPTHPSNDSTRAPFRFETAASWLEIAAETSKNTRKPRDRQTDKRAADR
eukprot:1589195-Rhodomonas_salina.1